MTRLALVAWLIIVILGIVMYVRSGELNQLIGAIIIGFSFVISGLLFDLTVRRR